MEEDFNPNELLPDVAEAFKNLERIECILTGMLALQHIPNLKVFANKGIDGMNLLDMVEMLCDWKAATMRHDDGDLMKSIEINEKRFNMSPQLVKLFKNTVPIIQECDFYHR